MLLVALVLVGCSQRTPRTQPTATSSNAPAISTPTASLDAVAISTPTVSRVTKVVRAAPTASASVSLTDPMAAPRAAHSATLLPDGRVLVAGGCTLDSCELGPDGASAELYDPETGAFTPTGRLTKPRVGHAGVLVVGKVLVLGGWDTDGVSASAELYDPDTGSFTPAGPMNSKRGGFTATRLSDGRVLIAGGYDGERYLASAELYDPLSGVFTSIEDMTAQRNSHIAAALPDGRVLMAGGSSGEGEVVASAEIFDSKSGKFSETGDMTVVRYKHGAAPLPDGRVLIVGGSDARDSQGRYASAEVYDAVSGAFTATDAMAAERFKLPDAVAVLPDGRVLVAGGSRRPEVYDPRSQTFGPVAGAVGSDWAFATATTLLDRGVLVTGGYDSAINPTAAAWLYRP